MNITDLITDRMHENLNPGDINEFEKYRWLVEMIATEHHANQAKDNEVLDIVSNRTSAKDIKKYRKQGRMSGAIKREGFYKIIAKRFDESYSDYDFTLLYDC